ncbi:MAG: tripartite tricarboxylate transporter TctB family protein [Granulosicoccus sp.]
MSDRLFGVVVLIAALAYIVSAAAIPTSFLTDPVGPKTFPRIVGGIAALCAVLIIIKPDGNPEWPTLRTWFALAIAMITLISYAYTLKPLGFLIPTAVAASVLSYQIRPRPLAALLTGLGLSFGLFIIFKYALGLGLAPVPKAWLG